MNLPDFVLYVSVFFIVFTKALDIHSTHLFIKKSSNGNDQEANAIARFLFKTIGRNITFAILFLFVLFLCFRAVVLYQGKSITDLLPFLCVTWIITFIQSCIVHSNYTGKPNIVVMTLLRLPPYCWSKDTFKKIINRLKTNRKCINQNLKRTFLKSTKRR